MTFEQLENYVSIRNEIEFTYQGKKYSITYWYPDDNEEKPDRMGIYGSMD